MQCITALLKFSAPFFFRCTVTQIRRRRSGCNLHFSNFKENLFTGLMILLCLIIRNLNLDERCGRHYKEYTGIYVVLV